ncbi:MAG: hypothetical protein WC222_04305 [Parachlamydiales bacterium]|jgi:hypothetical protein
MASFINDINFTYSSVLTQMGKVYSEWQLGGIAGIKESKKGFASFVGASFKTLGALAFAGSVFAFKAAFFNAVSIPGALGYVALSSLGLLAGHDLGEIGYKKGDANSNNDKRPIYFGDIPEKEGRPALGGGMLGCIFYLDDHGIKQNRTNEMRNRALTDQAKALAYKRDEHLITVSLKDMRMVSLVNDYFEQDSWYAPCSYIGRLVFSIHLYCLHSNAYNGFLGNFIADHNYDVKGKSPESPQ